MIFPASLAWIQAGLQGKIPAKAEFAEIGSTQELSGISHSMACIGHQI